jgi:hypothetical protein
LVLRVLALVFLIAAIVVHGDLRLVPIALVFGCLLVLFALRDRAQGTAGALWSGSANLIQGGKKFAGQLSLERRRVVWIPTDRSRGHDVSDINLDLRVESEVTFVAGPAMMDVIVTVSAAAGKYEFLTHRGPALQRVIRQFPGAS